MFENKGLVLDSEGRLVVGNISQERREEIQQKAQELQARSMEALAEASKVKDIAITESQMKVLCTRIHFLVDYVVQKDVSVVVFLDKSARPLLTLFLRFFSALYPDKPLPAIRFIDVTLHDISSEALKLPKEGKKRMIIVDDVVTGGNQKEASLKFFKSIDPENDWSFWSVLESQQDRDIFSSTPGYPQMPWHAQQYGTLVKNNVAGGSFAEREDDELKRKVGLKLRDTLNKGAIQYLKALRNTRQTTTS